jgi:hypothetical protein
MAVRKTSGRRALTEYWLEKRFGPPLKPLASLVGAKLETGRTHQVGSISPISAARWSAIRSTAGAGTARARSR